MDNKKDPKVIEQAYKINTTFSRIVLSDGDIEDIILALAKVCKAAISVISIHNETLAETDSGVDETFNDAKNENNVYAEKIVVNNEVVAYLNMTKPEKVITELDLMTLESAANSIAFILLKNQSTEEIEKSFRHEFLNDLVDGDMESKEEIIQRSTFYELDLTSPYILILINIESLDAIFPWQNKKETYKSLRKAFNLVFRTFFPTAKDSIIWSRSKSIIVLYPLAPEYRDAETDYPGSIKDFSRHVADRIKSAIENNIENINITVGLGRFYGDITELCNSYKEAVTATKIGRSIWGTNRIYHYEDLGFYRILEKYPHKAELSNYAKEVLNPLIEYDQKNRSQLLHTLKQLMDNCGNQKATAEKLFVHNKTLAYRKKKIQEILNLSLNDAEDIFNISMALRIMKVVDI